VILPVQKKKVNENKKKGNKRDKNNTPGKGRRKTKKRENIKKKRMGREGGAQFVLVHKTSGRDNREGRGVQGKDEKEIQKIGAKRGKKKKTWCPCVGYGPFVKATLRWFKEGVKEKENQKKNLQHSVQGGERRKTAKPVAKGWVLKGSSGNAEKSPKFNLRREKANSAY